MKTDEIFIVSQKKSTLLLWLNIFVSLRRYITSKIRCASIVEESCEFLTNIIYIHTDIHHQCCVHSCQQINLKCNAQQPTYTVELYTDNRISHGFKLD